MLPVFTCPSLFPELCIVKISMGDYRLLGIDTTRYQAQTGSSRYCKVSKKVFRLLLKLDIHYNPVVVSSFSWLFLIKFMYFFVFCCIDQFNQTSFILYLTFYYRRQNKFWLFMFITFYIFCRFFTFVYSGHELTF